MLVILPAQAEIVSASEVDNVVSKVKKEGGSGNA